MYLKGLYLVLSHQKRITQSRLGRILVERQYVSGSQLEKALKYQQEFDVRLGIAFIELGFLSQNQLNRALKRQNLLRTIAACLALVFTPFNVVLAEDKSNSTKAISSQENIRVSHSQKVYTDNLYFVTNDYIDDHSKDFYFSGKYEDGISLKKNFTNTSGLKITLLSSQQSLFDSQISYDFTPRISLFKSFDSIGKIGFSNNSILKDYSHYTNTKPVIYMITLKGRSLFRNSRIETEMWSLESSKYGVPRQAELMFAIIKEF